MKAVFVETTDFSEWVAEFFPDEHFAKVQQELMDNPDRGVVMSGCGGMRKLRTADPKRGQGKRGGARLIYLYVPEVKRFYLLDIYGKDEKDDLSAEEKKILRALAEKLKLEAKAGLKRSERKGER
jgi:hypothetical protein